MAVKLTEVARQAGVSPALVSRLLNRDPNLRIADNTRRRVLEVHRRLGGRINTYAHIRKACHIAVPVNHRFANSIQTLVQSPRYQAIQKTLRQNEGDLAIVFFEDEEEKRALIERIIRQGQPHDGLLFLGGVVEACIAQWLRDHAFPHVSTSWEDARYNVNTIHSDYYTSMATVVDHLLLSGHNRIGYVGHASYRYPMVAAQMLARGLRIEPQWEYLRTFPTSSISSHRASVHEFMRSALKQGPLPTALIAHSDDIAFGVLDAMHDLGLEPGRDIAVVGYDDIEGQEGKRWREETAAAILTTIHQPFATLGQYTAELLLEQVRGARRRIVHEQVFAPLLIRSSAPDPVSSSAP